MKKLTVTAKSKGEVVGTGDYDFADTLKDCVTIAGSEDAVVKLFNQARHTNLRNSLAKPASSAKRIDKLEVYNKLIGLKMNPEQAQSIAQLTDEELAEAKAA